MVKADLTAGGVVALAGLAVVGLGAWYLYSKRGTIAQAAGAAAEAVNPASPNNLVNRAVSAAGAAATGDKSWSLGGQLAEWFDPATRQVNREYGPDQARYAQPVQSEATREVNRLYRRFPPKLAPIEVEPPLFDPYSPFQGAA